MRRRMVGRSRFARSLSLAMAAGLLGVGLAAAGSITTATSAFAASAPTWPTGDYFSAIKSVTFCRQHGHLQLGLASPYEHDRRCHAERVHRTTRSSPSTSLPGPLRSAVPTTTPRSARVPRRRSPRWRPTPAAVPPTPSRSVSQPSAPGPASTGTVSMFDTNQDLETGRIPVGIRPADNQRGDGRDHDQLPELRHDVGSQRRQR